MPFSKQVKHLKKGARDSYYFNTYCCYCKQDLTQKPIIVLPCDHKAHMECIKKGILSRFYQTFWDNWGVYDFYCDCGQPLKHFCFCHSAKENCTHCLHHREHKVNNVEEVDRLNKACENQKVKGFYYRGEERVGEGNVEFVC